ncbi:mitochondrial intermediate cleaving peptidase 55 Icp55 Xaa-Pro aminopeptidase [Andalucia godoyi]|uniref:Mitochondrial intermediate cleaving peptidase 55 Icp55 Xaa-Pro aminopeptidase n=1 Tax=Andalucia godoyi TaxID=505711 RepID=A0A8K0AH25_ANDGO|nr:mitochondrial intermediate cleaving peptidase 55 Icp55 Xaa-Pro aminopeptidase [Andalucia godoyi]|eukprot:ANDGO_06220.mRNA.1 mitochondrial intermediate cleaving peptidase 55 Icp55 Xaa-Pro aminopeptidase
MRRLLVLQSAWSGRCLYSSLPRVALAQPHWTSHPHILPRPNMITPGISSQEFQERRTKLASALPNDCLFLVPGYPTRYVSHDIPYPFRQETDMFYFTGFQEPNSMFAAIKSKSGDNVKFIMFVRAKEPHEELWEGPRAGVEVAAREFGIEEVHSFADFAAVLEPHLASSKCISFNQNASPEVTATVARLLRTTWREDRLLVSASALTHRIRAVKSSAEIELMRDSCEIAAQAFQAVMQNLGKFQYEYELASLFEYECKRKGAERLSYPCVVGSGVNALSLHYIRADHQVPKNSLILMDAGCEKHMYASDISRTFPSTGVFQSAQKHLYEGTLAIQKTCLAACDSPSPPSLSELDELALRETSKVLIDLGFAKQHISSGVLPEHVIRRYFPHSIGHHLGIDVHDVAELGARASPLKSGMVITIEPGIYVRPGDPDSPPEFHGMGIRIEDDVLFTETGCEILTRSAPKEVSEIEAFASLG